MPKTHIKNLIRNLVIEIIVYSILLILYFLVVLRYLNGVLSNLFINQILIYAFLGLALIVAQGVLLEWLTSFLIRMLRLDRLH